MSVEAHRSAADGQGRTARIHVVVVSTTRTEKTDRSGALIRDLATAAGHYVSGVDFVPDDPRAIGPLLDALCARSDLDAVVLSGGTGISKRDGTVEVVAERLTVTLPGFGELFRALSYEEIGSAAMLSRALCGLVGDTLVASIPGSTGAVKLAMERLLLPEIRHILQELGKEDALVEVDAKAEISPAPAPSPASDSATIPASAWRTALQDLEGEVIEESWPDVPMEYAAVASVNDVLSRAGQRRSAQFSDGTTGLLFGYPDMVRPDACVLLVRAAAPEIVALHRVDGDLDDKRWSWTSVVGPNVRLGTQLLSWIRS